MINGGMINLFKKCEMELLDSGGKKEKLFIEFDEDNYMSEVELGPPSIIIKPDFRSESRVICRISIRSGLMRIRKYLGRGENKAPRYVISETKIKNWVISVPVDVGQ